MDVETFQRLGLDRTFSFDFTVNGHARMDIFQQLGPPGDAPYHPCPEAFPADDVPRGPVAELLDWSDSRVFQGSKRDIAIYTPAQLSTSTEEPGFIVFNDGDFYRDPLGSVRATTVLDTLHHRGQMPLTVAVFVLPGRTLDLPSARDGAQDQGGVSPTQTLAALDQRSDEYDRLTDDYPRFLADELLPLAEERIGRAFTSDPGRRVVCGVSSGGIAAFNAAWHRPESFGAVISHCGSFTNIQGGHNYPPLVRVTERKPIRVWMQSGESDLDVLAGNWALANKEMAAALDFSGYDLHFEFGTGGHGTRHGGSMFAETLRWLWPVDEAANA